LHRSDLLGEIQSDFHLRGEAEGATDEGGSVWVDSDEGTLLPVADTKDCLRCGLLRSISSGQDDDERFWCISEGDDLSAVQQPKESLVGKAMIDA